jgi:hypothetical protein
VKPSPQEAAGWEGRELFDANGEKIGTILGLAYRRERFGTFWLLVEGLDGVALVPATQITRRGDRLVLPYPRTYVMEGPRYGQARASRQEERKLLFHYGLDSQLAEGGCPQRCGLCGVGRRTPEVR